MKNTEATKSSVIPNYISLILVTAASVVLIGLHTRPEGWFLLLASLFSTHYVNKPLAKDLRLIILALAILGITDISTDISYFHMSTTAFLLGLAVIIPYFISRNIFKDNSIKFTLGSVKKWSRKQFFYIGFTAITAYLLIPFYLIQTGAYLNWPSESDTSSIIRLFIGTNGLGIWDELFFVVIVLTLLAKHFRFWIANIAQSILWTAFLYELGFIGWGPILVFIFAMLQGYVFRKTHSLLYVITIHLTLDFILFLALVNAHNPHLFNIFLT